MLDKTGSALTCRFSAGRACGVVEERKNCVMTCLLGSSSREEWRETVASREGEDEGHQGRDELDASAHRGRISNLDKSAHDTIASSGR